MKRIACFLATALIAAAATAAPGQPPEPKSVHGQGCVEAGVEVRCLVVKDIESGKLYNLLVDDPRPAIGEGIEFTGVVFDGATYCMQGEPVRVMKWTHKDSLKCASGHPPTQ
jgi:hypothetical protein